METSTQGIHQARRYGLIVLLMAALSIAGCDKKPTGIIVGEANFPGTPINLTVQVGDRLVSLSWQYADTAAFERFKVYRSSSLNPQQGYRLLASPASAAYTDRDVQNGVTYSYAVSAINAAGFEGRRSSEVTALPSIFSITLRSLNNASSAGYTNSQTVTLSATVSAGITSLLLSNDSTFANATELTLPGSRQVQWALSNGDGPKTVFAKFRDNAGNLSTTVASATIILDTRAEIRSISEDSGGQAKRPGEVIRFRMATGEDGGKATITINITNNIRTFTLSDSANGIYSAVFSVPSDIDVVQAQVSGSFVDRAGNVATGFAPTRVTILQPLIAPRLSTPALGADGISVSLTWDQNQNAGFDSYEVHRGETANFAKSAATQVTTISNRQSVQFTDRNLKTNTRFYYRVYVKDIAGQEITSNEVSVQTASDSNPGGVTMLTPTIRDDGAVQLAWSAYGGNDFRNYSIYRSLTPGVTSNSTLVANITNRGTTATVDTQVGDDVTYYYRIFVFNLSGAGSGSNEVSIRTPKNQPPTPVTLAVPSPQDTTRLRLNWSQNNDADFSDYLIYRSLDTPVDTTQTPIMILNRRQDTTFTDSNLRPRTTYYYRVFVRDTRGARSGSNEVSGTTN